MTKDQLIRNLYRHLRFLEEYTIATRVFLLDNQEAITILFDLTKPIKLIDLSHVKNIETGKKPESDDIYGKCYEVENLNNGYARFHTIYGICEAPFSAFQPNID